MRTVACLAAVLAASSCTAAKPIFDDAGGVDGGRDGSAPDASSDASDGGSASCESVLFAECDSTDALACETYVWADEGNCGACDASCDPSRLCVGAQCRVPLIAGVALGGDHTCVRTTSGHVLCWGRDQVGELGDGSYSLRDDDRNDAVAVLDIDDAVGLVSSGWSSCAIRGSERVVECWGGNRPARFGPEGEDQPRPRPTRLSFAGADEPILQVSVADSHICVRTATGAYCSGTNSSGELGTSDRELDTTELRLVDGLPPGEPRAVAAGGITSYGHSCVAAADGTVHCMGYNDCGQIGQDLGQTSVTTPSVVSGLTGIVDVQAGIAFTCALDDAGAVYCWGDNASGQLGNGTIGGDLPTPARVDLPPIGSIAVGAAFVLAVAADGATVYGWGEGGDGVMGRGVGDLGDQPTPRVIVAAGGSTYEAYAGGHACILDRRAGDADVLRCAGSNRYGELGLPVVDRVATYEPSEALP